MREKGSFLFLGISLVLFFVIIFVFMEIDLDSLKLKEKLINWDKKEEARENREERLLNSIKVAIELKNTEKAKELIYDYSVNFPQGRYLSEVNFLAAEAYYMEKDYEKAVDFIVKAARENTDTKIILLMSKIAVEMDRFNPILYSELTIAERNIKADYIYIGLGYQNIYSKIYDEAIKCFLRVQNEEGFKGLARAYIEKGDYEKAIENYLKFFSIADKNNLSYESVKKAFLKQTLYYADKLYEAKNQSFTNYYKILSDNFSEEIEGEISMVKLAGFYINKKEYNEAIKYLEKALSNKINDKDEEATYLLAQLYYAKGNKSKSYQIFNSFLQKYPLSSRISEIKEWISLLKKEIY
ncbi:MAG: tetratricopeptide repeat protein [Brevinematales bacterium]|nr:tetratricopeptide repeat protein [Brevinematales bacterium]